MVIRHEHQHNETMLQTIQLARLERYEFAGRHPVPSAPTPGFTGLELSRSRAVAADRRARLRVRLRQRAPASPHRCARLPDRPDADHERDLPDLRRGRRLRAPRMVVGRGLVVEGAVRHHETRRLDGGSRRRMASREARSHSIRTGPSSMSPGSRPTPSPVRMAPAFPPRSSGRRLRPGIRNGARRCSIRGGTIPRSTASTRTWTMLGWGPRRQAHIRRADPRRVPGNDRRRLGVDREQLRRLSRVRCSSVQGVLGGVLRNRLQGPPRRLLGYRAHGSSHRRSATGTTHSAGRSSPAFGLRGT